MVEAPATDAEHVVAATRGPNYSRAPERLTFRHSANSVAVGAESSFARGNRACVRPCANSVGANDPAEAEVLCAEGWLLHRRRTSHQIATSAPGRPGPEAAATAGVTGDGETTGAAWIRQRAVSG